jgi:hypothetical protein
MKIIFLIKWMNLIKLLPIMTTNMLNMKTIKLSPAQIIPCKMKMIKIF